MNVQVKICGNTTLEDARAATEAGADLLGFIFYDRSPRRIEPGAAGEIVTELRAEFGEAAPLMVGVFVDEPVEGVRAIMEQAGLDLAQLHGSEPPVEIRQLQPVAFKALRPQTRGDAEARVATYTGVLADNPAAPDFLIDAYHPTKLGGTGHQVDWAIGQVLARRFKVLLAGGLTPENVAEAIRTVQPWGVDVASGVEVAPGRKDHEQLQTFIREAKTAGRSLAESASKG